MNRDPKNVIVEIINVIENAEKPEDDGKYQNVKNSLYSLRSSATFRAPEMVQQTWRDLTEIVQEFAPGHTDLDEVQKSVVRIYTNNPNIV